MAVGMKQTKSYWWQKYRSRNYLIALLFALPALINFAIFRYYPMIWAARTSFWDYSLLAGYREMVGIGNYVQAFLSDPIFLSSLRTTFVFALFYVPIQVLLALGLAVFANQNRPGVGPLRAIIFIPVVTSFVVVSIIWGMILNQDVGLLNGFLQTLGFPRFSFIRSTTLALPSIIAISIWKNVGYSVIVLVAGLKSIPSMYYEAAIVDGANNWQQFRNITIPLLKRQVMFVTVWATLGAFQVFIPVYSLTQGGPSRTTNVIVYYIYKKAFVFNEMGYASALSIILLVILLLVSVAQMRLLRGEEL
jgi:ABC-type sugar transport system permease subunit